MQVLLEGLSQVGRESRPGVVSGSQVRPLGPLGNQANNVAVPQNPSNEAGTLSGNEASGNGNGNEAPVAYTWNAPWNYQGQGYQYPQPYTQGHPSWFSPATNLPFYPPPPHEKLLSRLQRYTLDAMGPMIWLLDQLDQGKVIDPKAGKGASKLVSPS